MDSLIGGSLIGGVRKSRLTVGQDAGGWLGSWEVGKGESPGEGPGVVDLQRCWGFSEQS